MPNIIPQNNLNRLRASLIVNGAGGLTITASYLGKEMIAMNFEGVATTPLDTATGVVYSPEPYQRATVTCHLVKSMALSDAWKAQAEQTTLIGDCVVIPDEDTGLGPYQLANCAIGNVNPMRFDGLDPNWTVTVTGIYYINAVLWVT